MDGGSRRWSVALACCFLNFVHLGVGRMSGLLYLAAMQRYGASRSQAALPFFLCYTVRNVSGPLIGHLGRRVTLRWLIMTGCFVASLGIGLCFFAEDIVTVTVLWGGVFGLGFGMATMLIPEVLNQHFDSYISIANGISFGGECVAGFILPFLIKFLLNTYGTSGLFLILSSLVLHSIPAAMILKPKTKRETKSPKADKLIGDSNTKWYTPASSSDSYGQQECSDGSLLPSATKKLTEHEKLLEDCEHSDNHTRNQAISSSLCSKSHEENFTACLPDGVHYKNCSHDHTTSFLPSDNSSSSISKDCADDSIRTISSNHRKSFFQSLRVFIDPSFMIILITQSSVIYVGTMILTIIVDYCRDSGLSDDDQVYVLMSFSTADMLGRFGLGWVTDRGYMSRSNFFALCHFCMGLSLGFLVFFGSFAAILVAVFFAGICLGGLLIVGPGIISDFIERDLVTMALASRFVLYAPMSLTQSPLIGFFRGTYGSYVWILVVSCFICILSATLTMLLPCSIRHRKIDTQRTSSILS